MIAAKVFIHTSLPYSDLHLFWGAFKSGKEHKWQSVPCEQDQLNSGRRASRGKSDVDIRCLCIFFYRQCITRKRLPWKRRMAKVPFDDKYSILSISRWLSPFARYSQFEVCNRENVGQRHDEEHSQWRHSMANTGPPIWWQWQCLHFPAFVKITTWQVWP